MFSVCKIDQLRRLLENLLNPFTSFSHSTHCHAQLPRRRGPLPGDASGRKRTRPLPEGQREPGGQTPREDVAGRTDRRGGREGRKEGRKQRIFSRLKAHQQLMHTHSSKRLRLFKKETAGFINPLSPAMTNNCNPLNVLVFLQSYLQAQHPLIPHS